jgi:hypothetical protein
MSIVFLYNHIVRLNFFNQTVAIFYGLYCFFLVWVTLNSLIAYILSKNSDFVIIIIGIIPLYFLANNSYKAKLDSILLVPFEKITTENEVIFRCYSILNKVKTAPYNPEEEQKLIGLINNHFCTCQDQECHLRKPANLYDPCTHMYVGKLEPSQFHKSKIFLKHFCKLYFDEAIKAFSSSVRVRIACTEFFFTAFNNVHVALEELIAAKKAKPGFVQSMEIFRIK